MDFGQVKHIPQEDRDLIFGYIREAQSLLPNEDNSYYNIPQIVGFLTVLYFYLAEYFEFAAHNLELSDDGMMIKWNGSVGGITESAYGNIRINNTTRCKKCVWKFRIDIIDLSSLIEFGLVSADYEHTRGRKEATAYHIFECGDYDGEAEDIEVYAKNEESICKDESIDFTTGLRNQDVIMMEFDLEMNRLSVFVNENKYDRYFKIEMNDDIEYKMLVDIDDVASVILIDFQTY